MSTDKVKKDVKDLNKPTKNKSESAGKATHLYLHDKYLTSITNLSGYHNLTVLYLHNNKISSIENVNSLRHLVSLYLQKNNIRKIENLENMTKLKRLYLGHNEISVVENLDKLVYLEELHVEKQKISTGESLCFDPRTVLFLSRSLQVLNTSHNNLLSVDNLSPLKYLRTINASHNKIDNLKNITGAVSCWFYLQEAMFNGNPVSKGHRYRENIIANSHSLKSLDNKQISDNTRCFIKRFEQEKINFENKDVTTLPDKLTDISKNYPLSVQKAVSNLILKPSLNNINESKSLSTGLSSNDAYIPWRALPQNSTYVKNKVPPLLRRQKKRNEPNSIVTVFPRFT